MSNNLIINIRQHLHWRKRLFSDTTTAMMWGAWLYLWRPVLMLGSAQAIWSVHKGSVHFALASTSDSLQYVIEAVLVGCLILLLWTFLPTKRATATSERTLEDYAEHFQVPTEQIVAGRGSSICTVFHDEHGQLLSIRSDAPAAVPVTLHEPAAELG
jgi:poly-beta-1,6-N-acetyl-D-glucosamine biosynthesis protein PgaD